MRVDNNLKSSRGKGVNWIHILFANYFKLPYEMGNSLASLPPRVIAPECGSDLRKSKFGASDSRRSQRGASSRSVWGRVSWRPRKSTHSKKVYRFLSVYWGAWIRAEDLLKTSFPRGRPGLMLCWQRATVVKEVKRWSPKKTCAGRAFSS